MSWNSRDTHHDHSGSLWWMKRSREGYRDPLYLNKEKMDCAWYPYSNGSIYGNDSNIFTGTSTTTRRTKGFIRENES